MRLMLTGISQETHFSPPSVILYLIFNNGDLKVPVTEEQAELVMEQYSELMEGAEDPDVGVPEAAPRHLVPVPDHDVTESEEEEDGVGQA